MAEIAYLGIRHHGPGSARRVLSRLDALRPGKVLIEGPADLTDQLPHLAHPQMVPPVALLAYSEKQPESAVFWPFAEYSPEYQAAVWAIRHGVELAFIDLPVAQRFDPSETTTGDEETSCEDDDPAPPEPVLVAPQNHDPFTILGQLLGYEDGESFWNDFFETEGGEDGFDAIDTAIEALSAEQDLTPMEARREAHMRLEIAKAAKETEAPVAVVCGAWHVPALKAKHTAKADRDLLKGFKKEKIKSSWVPWTSPRLSRASGYGAGVQAPKWYEHLWRAGSDEGADAAWSVHMARLMREAGHVVSAASSIEMIRLARSLAALRERPRPGFEELREAAIACLSFGEVLPWREIETQLLLGSDVGHVPADLPLAPLLEDLTRQQKKAKLKPQALEKELSLDLRTSSGLTRSTLLHRLNTLDVPWGKEVGSGRSRGTFRENWLLRWEPEYAVELVEKLIYGTTIETACSARLSEQMQQETSLAALSDLTFMALTAQIPRAVDVGIQRMDDIAALTDDCGALLSAVPALVETIRYGQARETNTDALIAIVTRMVTQGAICLPLAARGLAPDEATRFFEMLPATQQAIGLAALGDDLTHAWAAALQKVALEERSTPIVAGVAARLCYEAAYLDEDAVATRVTQAISPGVLIADAAGFFEGFFTGSGQRLIHDSALRRVVDAWLLSLDEEGFVAHLPLLRRVFSCMDKNERHELLGRLLGHSAAQGAFELVENADEIWARHAQVLTRILNKEPTHVP